MRWTSRLPRFCLTWMKNKLTGEEIQLLSRWKQLDIRQKKVIMDTIEAFGKTE